MIWPNSLRLGIGMSMVMAAIGLSSAVQQAHAQYRPSDIGNIQPAAPPTVEPPTSPPVQEQRVRQSPDGQSDSTSSHGATQLPPRAQVILSDYHAQRDAIRAEAADKLAKKRQEAIAQLQDIQQLMVKVGEEVQVKAIQQAIDQIQAEQANEAAVGAPAVLPDPGTLVDYRSHVGQRFVFRVTGSTQGTIWGNTLYSDDSPLAVAAVHAGIVNPGATANVRVTLLPGLESYDGVTRNGITSQPYGAWQGSYLVEAVPPPASIPTSNVPSAHARPAPPSAPAPAWDPSHQAPLPMSTYTWSESPAAASSPHPTSGSSTPR